MCFSLFYAMSIKLISPFSYTISSLDTLFLCSSIVVMLSSRAQSFASATYVLVSAVHSTVHSSSPDLAATAAECVVAAPEALVCGPLPCARTAHDVRKARRTPHRRRTAARGSHTHKGITASCCCCCFSSASAWVPKSLAWERNSKAT